MYINNKYVLHRPGRSIRVASNSNEVQDLFGLNITSFRVLLIVSVGKVISPI